AFEVRIEQAPHTRRETDLLLGEESPDGVEVAVERGVELRRIELELTVQLRLDSDLHEQGERRVARAHRRRQLAAQLRDQVTDAGVAEQRPAPLALRVVARDVSDGVDERVVAVDELADRLARAVSV